MRHTGTHRDTEGHTETAEAEGDTQGHRDTQRQQRHTEGHTETQRETGTQGDTQRHRNTQGHTDATTIEFQLYRRMMCLWIFRGCTSHFQWLVATLSNSQRRFLGDIEH